MARGQSEVKTLGTATISGTIRPVFVVRIGEKNTRVQLRRPETDAPVGESFLLPSASVISTEKVGLTAAQKKAGTNAALMAEALAALGDEA
jgi:hypothetical protein